MPSCPRARIERVVRPSFNSSDRRGVTRPNALGAHPVLVRGPEKRAEDDQRQVRDRRQAGAKILMIVRSPLPRFLLNDVGQGILSYVNVCPALTWISERQYPPLKIAPLSMQLRQLQRHRTKLAHTFSDIRYLVDMTAISCLGASRTLAATARGWSRHSSVRKPAQEETSRSPSVHTGTRCRLI